MSSTVIDKLKNFLEQKDIESFGYWLPSLSKGRDGYERAAQTIYEAAGGAGVIGEVYDAILDFTGFEIDGDTIENLWNMHTEDSFSSLKALEDRGIDIEDHIDIEACILALDNSIGCREHCYRCAIKSKSYVSAFIIATAIEDVELLEDTFLLISDDDTSEVNCKDDFGMVQNNFVSNDIVRSSFYVSLPISAKTRAIAYSIAAYRFAPVDVIDFLTEEVNEKLVTWINESGVSRLIAIANYSTNVSLIRSMYDVGHFESKPMYFLARGGSRGGSSIGGSVGDSSYMSFELYLGDIKPFYIEKLSKKNVSKPQERCRLQLSPMEYLQRYVSETGSRIYPELIVLAYTDDIIKYITKNKSRSPVTGHPRYTMDTINFILSKAPKNHGAIKEVLQSGDISEDELIEKFHTLSKSVSRDNERLLIHILRSIEFDISKEKFLELMTVGRVDFIKAVAETFPEHAESMTIFDSFLVQQMMKSESGAMPYGDAYGPAKFNIGTGSVIDMQFSGDAILPW